MHTNRRIKIVRRPIATLVFLLVLTGLFAAPPVGAQGEFLVRFGGGCNGNVIANLNPDLVAGGEELRFEARLYSTGELLDQETVTLSPGQETADVWFDSSAWNGTIQFNLYHDGVEIGEGFEVCENTTPPAQPDIAQLVALIIAIIIAILAGQ